MEPNSIGKYEIIETLGKGSMGVVYKARDPQIGRTVAIKTLRSVLLTDDAPGGEALQRFKAESRSAGRLQHPNIVTIYEAGRTESGSPYLVMEFIEGQNLDTLIKERAPLDPVEALHLLAQLASAVDYAHSQSVIHRDIKPSNVIVDPQFRVHLLDFGVAKLSDTSLTPAGTVVGTPSYMSPEQIRGEVLDGASDLFALGVMAFELLTGKRPFPGNDFTTVVSNIIHREPLSFAELRVPLPTETEGVLRRSIAKLKTERHRSCLEFVDTLARTLTLVVDGSGIAGGYRSGLTLAGVAPGVAAKIKAMRNTIEKAELAAKARAEQEAAKGNPSAEWRTPGRVKESRSRGDALPGGAVGLFSNPPVAGGVTEEAGTLGKGIELTSSSGSIGEVLHGASAVTDKRSGGLRVLRLVGAATILSLLCVGIAFLLLPENWRDSLMESAREFGASEEQLESDPSGGNSAFSSVSSESGVSSDSSVLSDSSVSSDEALDDNTTAKAIGSPADVAPESAAPDLVAKEHGANKVFKPTAPAALSAIATVELATLSDEELAFVIEQVSADSGILTRVLHEIRKRPRAEFFPFLSKLTDHSEYRVRIELLKTLALPAFRNVSGVRDQFEKALADPEFLVRGFALKLFAEGWGGAVMPIIRERLSGERNEVVLKMLKAAEDRMSQPGVQSSK